MIIYDKEGGEVSVKFPIDAVEAIRSGEYTFENPKNKEGKTERTPVKAKIEVGDAKEEEAVTAKIAEAAENDRKEAERQLAEDIEAKKKASAETEKNPNVKVRTATRKVQTEN